MRERKTKQNKTKRTHLVPLSLNELLFFRGLPAIDDGTSPSWTERNKTNKQTNITKQKQKTQNFSGEVLQTKHK